MILSQIKHLVPGRNNKAHVIIHGSATEASVVGFATAQVPGDRIVIGGVQILMIIEIAALFGASLTKAGAIALFESQLATVVGIEMANQGIKYIPVLGNVINGSVAFSVTEIIGWATYSYYEKNNG